MKFEEYQFSEKEISILKQYRDNQLASRLKQRFLALLMIAEGGHFDFVKSVLGISHSSLQRWFDNYHNKGIDSLNSFQYQPKQSFLDETQSAELVDWVKKKAQVIEK